MLRCSAFPFSPGRSSWLVVLGLAALLTGLGWLGDRRRLA
jgi:LPXTG-motif cell wall-anchored protein